MFNILKDLLQAFIKNAKFPSVLKIGSYFKHMIHTQIFWNLAIGVKKTVIPLFRIQTYTYLILKLKSNVAPLEKLLKSWDYMSSLSA